MESFPCRSLSKRGAQDISLYIHVWRPSYVRTVILVLTLQLNVIIFSSLPQADAPYSIASSI